MATDRLVVDLTSGQYHGHTLCAEHPIDVELRDYDTKEARRDERDLENDELGQEMEVIRFRAEPVKWSGIPDNQKRARRGEEAIARYAKRDEAEGDEFGNDFRTEAVDLIANILHALACNGHDPEAALAMARRHFDDERTGEG